VKKFNVPQGYASLFHVAAALLDGHFEHPATTKKIDV